MLQGAIPCHINNFSPSWLQPIRTGKAMPCLGVADVAYWLQQQMREVGFLVKLIAPLPPQECYCMREDSDVKTRGGDFVVVENHLLGVNNHLLEVKMAE